MVPVFLSIAGSDCSAGAGLQADLKTGFALGCYPLTAVTCVVSEAPGTVEGIVPMAPDFVAGQVRLCLRSFPVAAVKAGMLYSPQIAHAAMQALADFPGPLVVDPVMVATAGEPLVLQETIAAYGQAVFPRATLLTPNLDELQRLCGCAPLHTAGEMEAAARQLCAQYGCAVLAKGGHMPGGTCTDILVQPGRPALSWSHPRTAGISTHGTGCTLSSAVTAHLALGHPLPRAVELSLAYVAGAIARSHRFPGTDALNHAKG
ncbi:MAG: bifunctional hydroxymethylpyrimidine kinase/phosphomethylpyrimidine kinase [Akkermansia sp.]|nr:bifunctional hydroxymethylpyrimidine kinase/phosphomethylpyrimidine kinase [Akkermansia sp.]